MSGQYGHKDVKKMKGIILSILVCFGLVSTASAGNFNINSGGNEDYIEFSGGVVKGDDLRLANYLTQFPNTKLLKLNSYGGDVQTGWNMAKIVRAQGLDTEVESGKQCASACTYIYSGGIKRSADDDVVFGFHPATINTVPNGWSEKHVYTSGQYAGLTALKNYVTYIGLEKAYDFSIFLQKVYANTWHNSLYNATKYELIKSGFINA